jgi:hypothetical protein
MVKNAMQSLMDLILQQSSRFVARLNVCLNRIGQQAA